MRANDELADHLKGRTRAQFLRDKGLQRIAERLLEVAGEAAIHVPDDVADRIEIDWTGLRAMRIVLAHAYHRIDPQALWTAATIELPRLAKTLRSHAG